MRFFTAATLHFILLLPLGFSAAAAENRPNLLFILTDDEGWTTLSCYGSS